MKLAYYPGCTLKTKAKNFEDSAIASAKALGIELVELPDWNCCGVVHSLVTDNLIFHLGAIRNLIRVQEMNENRVVVLCSMCYNTLKRTNLRIQNSPDELSKVNDFMYLEKEDYKGNVEVVHFLNILKNEIGFDKIKEKVKKPLKNIKIAPYYGCTLLRPKEVSIDNPENPTVLEEIVEALWQSLFRSHTKSCVVVVIKLCRISLLLQI